MRSGVLVGAVALVACAQDVLVGRNRETPLNAGESSELLAVRRLPSGAHVAVGTIGCDATLATCDGWLATLAAGSPATEARVATPGRDVLRGLALAGEDRIAIGTRTPAGGPASAFVARRTANGAVWETALAADGTRPTEGRAITIAGDGTLVAAWNEVQPDGVSERGWVSQLGADGSIARRVRLGGTPSTEGTAITSLGTLPSGVTYLGGRHEGVPTVVQLGPSLENYGSKNALGLPGVLSGDVKTILTDRNVEVTVCAEVDATIAVLRFPDSLGAPLASRVLDDPAPLALGGCAVTDDGAAILVAGTVGAARPWAAKLERVSLAVQWTRTFEEAGARLEAVAPAAGGAGVAVGSRDARAFVFRLEP